MMIDGMKCCVLLSGGTDSTTATYWALNQNFETEAIYFSLGEKRPEHGLESSMKLADKTGIRLHVLKVPLTQEGYLSLLPLNRLTQDERRNGSSVSVFASLVMWLTLGAAFCEKESIRRLVLGLNSNNVKRFKGITREFFAGYEELFEGWMGRKVEIVTPFLESSKAEVLQIGFDLGVPFALTWSCRGNGTKPCGRCRECKERREAFRQLHRVDPLGTF